MRNHRCERIQVTQIPELERFQRRYLHGTPLKLKCPPHDPESYEASEEVYQSTIRSWKLELACTPSHAIRNAILYPDSLSSLCHVDDPGSDCCKEKSVLPADLM